MQFLKGELKLEDLYYHEREEVKVVVRRLNTVYWLQSNFRELHILISKVTIGNIIFLIMYEGQEANITQVEKYCKDYLSKLKEESNVSKLDYCGDKMMFSEISLSSFCDLFSEEWLDKMYDDKPAIMDVLHIDNSKLICKEGLLEPLCEIKSFTRRYIPEDELARIRNSRISRDTIVYPPVHYIISEDNSSIAEQMTDEIIYELRKARRVTSRRILKLSSSNTIELERNGYKIQNLNNLDGGIVRVDLRDCEIDTAGILIKSVYSEHNHYLGKYQLIFQVAENSERIIDEIKSLCSLWPFIVIRNKRLLKKAAIKQLNEVAKANNVSISKETCLHILNNSKEFTYNEINDLFRKWLLTEYTVKQFHPQYSQIIDEYYNFTQSEGDALNELHNLVGLSKVKQLCETIINFYELQKLRAAELPDVENIGMHMMFTGNPGTAKTTVARLISKIFKQKGILSKGELIEVGRSDLVGKYVGWTAKTVKGFFDQARGSVLFIDEAYALVDDDKNSFGTEAINTIVQEMENRRDDVVVIFSGYKKEMHDFISSNSGLESRISFSIDFPDYSGQELYEILQIFAKKSHYELNDDVKEAFMCSIEKFDTTKGNGRIVRNAFEQARLRQSQRIMKMPKTQRKKELFTLIGEDFGGEYHDLC